MHGHSSRTQGCVATRCPPNRGQYGIFVTTSYFTKQAQEEVLEDRYPTTLVAGADLVRIMREMRVAQGTEINPRWLQS